MLCYICTICTYDTFDKTRALVGEHMSICMNTQDMKQGKKGKYVSSYVTSKILLITGFGKQKYVYDSYVCIISYIYMYKYILFARNLIN